MASASTAQPDEQLRTPPAYIRSTASQDDHTLRQVFDSQSFWKNFSSQTTHQASGRRSGLLQNKFLTSPQGFSDFSQEALQKCRDIVSRVLAASSTEDYKRTVRDLDRLSDQLCRVIDLVDFIRNVHPDHRIQQAASQSHGLMYEYMNVLNTTRGLDAQLRKAVSMSEVTASWSEEEKVTARILLKDFAQSAVEGPETTKDEFIKISNDIVQVGSELLDEMAPDKTHLHFPSSKFNGMDPMAVKKMTKWGQTSVPTNGGFASLALRTVSDSDVRKDIFIANRTASRKSIERVERLASQRAKLAKLSGHNSYAHMALSDKMAKTPEAVNQFLEALAANNKENVNRDLCALLKLKQADGVDGEIQAWDRDYYTTRLRDKLYANSRPSDLLSAYFSLGTVFQGLSRLFNRLYGIRLVPAATLPGETWNDDVRRLNVIDENEGHIAVLYCDLFERANKSPNPAHFTLRCSREISADEIAEAQSAKQLSANPSMDELSVALNDGMALNTSTPPDSAQPVINQLPTIAFICDFSRPSPGSSQPTLLSFRQLSTLFHEMGHALHSMLGRTRLQNVSGTRCATDFAELPSVLMEHFAASPQVLALYARHWETDKPLDVALVARELKMNAKLGASAELESQIQLSLLDQAYHSAAVPTADSARWSSTDVYRRIWNDPRFASVPEPHDTAWQGFFGHLFGYGAVYYSYLFDRAIAGKVFKDVFDGDKAVDRTQGLLYRDEVLKWGGGRDPWACVAGVLGPSKSWMSAGGEEAMKEVGRWGAGEHGGDGNMM